MQIGQQCKAAAKKPNSSEKNTTKSLESGGSVAEWLGCQTSNPEVVGSSPVLTTMLELLLGGP